MKNQVQNLLTLLIVLTIISCSKDEPTSTCSDGILNGTEIEIDCGGTNCDECLSIEGVWIATSFKEDGINILPQIGVVFYDYWADGTYRKFVGKEDFNHIIDDKRYTINSENTILKGFDTANNNSYSDVVLKKESLILTGTYNNKNFKKTFVRVNEDLCISVNCSMGNCYYGYCL